MKNNKRKHWTKAMDMKLASLYRKMSASEVAKEFGCSTTSIYFRAGVLGLTKGGRQLSKWLPENDAKLVDVYGSMTLTAMAELFGSTKSSVRWRATKLGLVGDEIDQDQVHAIMQKQNAREDQYHSENRPYRLKEEPGNHGGKIIKFGNDWAPNHGLKTRPKGLSGGSPLNGFQGW